MAAESAKIRISKSGLDQLTERELRALLAAIVNAIQNIATKLDADSGVTATDFASTTAAIIID